MLLLGGEALRFGLGQAQQVAAMRPQYATRDEVPADVVEKERRIYEQITRDEGKPEAAVPKIVEGRLGGFYRDVVLTEQAFVKDNKQSIAQILKAAGVDVKSCQTCHVDKLPKKDDGKHELNDEGKWLVAEKEKKGAKKVDGAWLKDYPKK